MSTNPTKCAATPAALASQVDYVQKIIEDSYAGSIAIVNDLPGKEDSNGDMSSHLRNLYADNGRTYSILASVSDSTNGEGQLRLYVDAKGARTAYGEIRLTTTPDTDSALVSALNFIAEINEKQNITN